MEDNTTADTATPAPVETKQPLGFWQGLALTSAVCLFAVAAALLVWLQFDSIYAIRTTLSMIWPWATLLRLTLIALLIVFWVPLSHRVTHWRRGNEHQLAYLLSMRWPFAIMLICMELFIVQNAFGRLLTWSLAQ